MVIATKMRAVRTTGTIDGYAGVALASVRPMTETEAKLVNGRLSRYYGIPDGTGDA